MILAIDTTSGTSAAVIQDGQVLGFSGFDDPYGHAENVGRAIQEALSQSSAKSEQIERVAISRGPASYTGLRVGMAAGFAFAIACQIPIHGIVSLDAVSAAFSDHELSQWLVTSDAKRGELFVGSYSGFDQFGLPKRIHELEVMKPEQLEAKYPGVANISEPADAKLVGLYAERALAAGVVLDDASALYLRSPDVTPSSGKRVSG